MMNVSNISLAEVMSVNSKRSDVSVIDAEKMKKTDYAAI